MQHKPQFLENSPKTICDQIIWLIKNSGLNFQLKETPFGLEISLKKRFVHHWNQNNQVKEHFSQQTQVSEPIQPAFVPPPGFPIPAHAAQHVAHAPPEVVEHHQQVSKQAQSHVPDATSELKQLD